jgi:hypothetical protein
MVAKYEKLVKTLLYCEDCKCLIGFREGVQNKHTGYINWVGNSALEPTKCKTCGEIAEKTLQK